MRTLITNKAFLITLFLFLELVSIGMGMGVPIFTIIFGFLVGLSIPMILKVSTDLSPAYLSMLAKAAILTSTVTLLGMAVIWLPTVEWLFDSTRDLTNFGIPMILYTPRASFIGWIILMVLISPFLQFLMTLFGSISWIVLFADRWGKGTRLSGNTTAA